MLNVRLIAVGKNKENWIDEGCRHYQKLLSRYAAIDWKFLPVRHSRSLSPTEIKRKEAQLLRKEFSAGAYQIALDINGKKLDSLAFARLLESLLVSGKGTLEIIIGGAYGIDESILKEVPLTLSLSPLTFSHQLVRLVFLEQLYRAFSILHGTDYHK